MYLGGCKLTEYKPPSIIGEFPWISAESLSKISSSNIVKAKSQKFHRLLLKLSLICSCFCHISFSSVSDSKGQRSVASSIPIFVARNAENSNPLLLAAAGLLLIISVKWEHGHQPLWKILSKWEGTWTSCLFKGNHQPEEWDHSKSVWWLTAAKKGRTHHPLCRDPIQYGHMELDQLADLGEWLAFVSCFNRLIFCGIICLINLWSHLNPSSGKQCVSTHYGERACSIPSLYCEIAHKKSIITVLSIRLWRTKMRVSTHCS